MSKNVDFSRFLGTWVNSNADTQWFKKFTLSGKDGRYAIRVQCAQEPHDWGEAEVRTYWDNIGELAFCAHYDLGHMDSLLAANANKGLFVIAAFHHFKNDPDRENFLCREFYVPETSASS